MTKLIPKTLKNKNGSISLGRSTFVLLMITSIVKYWWVGTDIPPNLYMTLATVLVYELGKKGRDTYEAIKSNSTTTTVDTEP